MSNFKHSVHLQVEKCKGCTNCVKRCPTEAIRIQNGHSVIDEERCIDCGECIKHCPYKAKKALSDKLDKYKDYKYKIALPAPALYGQFDNLDDIDFVVSGLLECGFDDVFEVAKAAEIISEYTRNYLRRTDIAKPVISSACPVIARLISKRFPYLCDNLLPIIPPIELAAKMAKQEAKQKHPELNDGDICAVFISPCPAKVSYVRNPIGVEKSAVDGVVSISEIYFLLVNSMKKIVNPEVQSQTGLVGVSWAGSGGEAAALFNDKYLSADGIENCIKVLDEIENENFAGLEFIELNACSGGCVGGALTVENPYIAKARLQILRRYLPVSQNHIERRDPTEVPEGYIWDQPIEYSPVMQLDSDMGEAMKKMADIQAIYEMFPHLDCGACGAPTCRAFAEDVVKNNGDVSDCIFIMRERIRELYKEREENDGK
ncbi:MAG: 4Fe-4S dicluster domain-containing protein [Ruminococcaceae bacterium]|nr:4Fe-4S dicluster domain-containing protein [Oscillospiraceae bacterium]